MIPTLNLNKNSVLILENIIQNGNISQNEIANQTNINRSIVSKEMTHLETTNLLNVSIEKNKKILNFNHKFANTILIEIDRDFIRGFLNTSLGYSLEKMSVNIDVMEVAVLFSNVEKIIENFISISKVPIIGIGFAIHGIVDHQEIVSYAPNTKWYNLNLKEVVEKEYNIPTTVLNVANVSALTENVIAKEVNKSQVSINVHSGVGAGLILNGKLFVGAHGHSLEIGHIPLFGYHQQCECGSTGCLETEISYPKLIEKMKYLGIENPSITNFISLCNNNDETILDLYYEYITLLAFGIQNIYLIIDPEILKINCEIFQSVPKSIEILKSKLNSNIIKTSNISISNLDASTRCLGLSILLTKNYLGLNNINIYNQSQFFIDSYNR